MITTEWIMVIMMWCQVANDRTVNRKAEKDCRQYFLQCIANTVPLERQTCFYRPKQDPFKEEIVR